MSEHPQVEEKAFLSLMAGQELGLDDEVRIRNHLMYSSAHTADGFDVLYGGGRSSEELDQRFAQAMLTHKAAVLKGEVTAETLYSGPID